MISKLFSFLNEIGFSEIQINIYKHLLTHTSSTINEMRNELNYSYTQVYHNLLFLEDKELIESSNDSKPKLYIRKSPKIALTELINKKFDTYKDEIIKLDEELKIQESKFGRCIKDITFYHYSEISLAIENFYDLIENTKKEIVLTSLPSILLKKLEPSLYEAFMRGVKIIFYFSQLDFEVISNYLEIITDILKRIRVEIIQTEQKTCQVIRYNDEIVNMGNILLDENYLNSIVFKEDEVFHINGFRGPLAKEPKNYLKVLNVVKRLEIEYPEPIQKVMNIIKDNKSIKTRDLSRKSKIGGTKLREILDFLIDQGILQEKIKNEDKVGRPKREYTIIDQI